MWSGSPSVPCVHLPPLPDGHYRIPVWLTSGARFEKLAQLHLLGDCWRPTPQVAKWLCESVRRCVYPFECALRDLRVNYVPNEQKSMFGPSTRTEFLCRWARPQSGRVRRREGARGVRMWTPHTRGPLPVTCWLHQPTQTNPPTTSLVWTACGRAPEKYYFCILK